ncbi:MAG: tetratricopeptide repeat protein [Planctomycetota bacterium]
MNRLWPLIVCTILAFLMMPAASADDSDALAEDLEIMSHLIAGSFGTASSLPHSFDESHPFASPPPRRIGPVDAFRLPGYGTVFQLTVSGVRFDGPGKTKTENQPASRWEQTRRALSGDQAKEDVAQCTSCHVPSPQFSPKAWHWMSPDSEAIEERLLDLLAENAHHLRGLEEDEKVAIVLLTPAPGDGGFGPKGSIATLWGDTEAKDSYGPPPGTTEEPPANDVSSTEYRADLLMRQGKIQAAIDAYFEAMDVKDGDPKVLEEIPLLSHLFRQESPAEKEQRRRLYGKLSRAYIMLGDYEKAEGFLQAVKATSNSALPTLGEKMGDREKKSIPVRKRLVISVSFRDLERLASGEITRAELDARAERDRYSGSTR